MPLQLAVSSGQSANPNRLDFFVLHGEGGAGSGQSANPNRLDWQCDNPLSDQGVFRFWVHGKQ